MPATYPSLLTSRQLTQVQRRPIGGSTVQAFATVSPSTLDGLYLALPVPAGAWAVWIGATQDIRLIFLAAAAGAPARAGADGFIILNLTAAANPNRFQVFDLDPQDPPTIWVTADSSDALVDGFFLV